MKTISTDIYQIDEIKELLPDVFKKIIDRNRNVNVEAWFWHEDVYEDVKAVLKALGFYEIDIGYSGFGSQGDGASFTAKWDSNFLVEECVEEVKKNGTQLTDYAGDNLLATLRSLLEKADHASFTIYRGSNHYSHANTVYAELTCMEKGDEPVEEPDSINDTITESCRETMKAIYQMLEKQYFEDISDERVEEALEDIGDWYDKNGNRRNDQ